MEDRFADLMVAVKGIQKDVDYLRDSQALQTRVLDEIKTEVKKTNGRVTTLESKNNVREVLGGSFSKFAWIVISALISLLSAVTVLVLRDRI